jgi:hypothetical protein
MDLLGVEAESGASARQFKFGTVLDRRFSQKIHSDNFHVDLLFSLHLLNTSLLVTVRTCFSETNAGHSLGLGKQPAVATNGRRWTPWVKHSVF